MVCFVCLLVWFGFAGLIGLKNGMYWILMDLDWFGWIDWFKEWYVLDDYEFGLVGWID